MEKPCGRKNMQILTNRKNASVTRAQSKRESIVRSEAGTIVSCHIIYSFVDYIKDFVDYLYEGTK